MTKPSSSQSASNCITCFVNKFYKTTVNSVVIHILLKIIIEHIIEIFCEDGVRYELHYWYTSGFSFLHGREDPYASILTRFAADGTAETAWRMVYDFDASYRDWEKQHLSH